MGFHNCFAQLFQTIVSLSRIDRLAWNWNQVFPYMYSLCLLHKILSYESIAICYLFPKGIFEGPTALAAAGCNIIALYCACTCPDTFYRCPKNVVQFSEHPIEWELLHWAWGHKHKGLILCCIVTALLMKDLRTIIHVSEVLKWYWEICK